jgi:MFS family permease
MAERRPLLFRGWIVLAGLFIVMTTGSGFAFYAQGVFLKALVDEQGFSTGRAGAGTGIFFFASGIGGYFAGGLISRYDVRTVMTIGSVFAAAGIALLGQIHTEWQMVLVMILFGAGYSMAGLVPSTSVVTRWFHRQRSVALSIASTGLSVGGIAISPVIAGLIDADSLEVWAPRLAVAFLIGILPAAWLLVRPWPEKLGLRPDGDPHDPSTDNADGTPRTPPGTPYRTAVRSRFFVLLSLGFILIMGAQVGAIQHAFKLTSDRVGLDAAQVTLMVLSATSVVARITGGLVARKVSLSKLTGFLIGVQVIGIALIGIGETQVAITIGVVVLGSSMGNLLMLHPLLLADAFGIRDYPRIYGMGSLLMILGVGTGPFIVGIVKDATDYRTAFLVMAALGALGGLVYLFAGKPPTVDDGQPPEPEIDLRDRPRRTVPLVAPSVFEVQPA